MTLDRATPPGGTVGGWLARRAEAGGTAIVFPEDGSTLGWAELHDDIP